MDFLKINSWIYTTNIQTGALSLKGDFQGESVLLKTFIISSVNHMTNMKQCMMRNYISVEIVRIFQCGQQVSFLFEFIENTWILRTFNNCEFLTIRKVKQASFYSLVPS